MESTNLREHLLTVAELADYARCSTASIYRWVREGKLASKKVGHRRLFRASEAQKLLGYMPAPRKEAANG
jgi:excisionase family DNA binding protein